MMNLVAHSASTGKLSDSPINSNRNEGEDINLQMISLEMPFRTDGEVLSKDRKIRIEIEHRRRCFLANLNYKVITSEYAPYILTCADEFTRNLCTFSLAKSQPAIVPYEAELLQNIPISKSEETVSPSGNFLRHYHPCYQGHPSKLSVLTSKDAFDDYSPRDKKIIIQIEDIKFKNGLSIFEPLFGTLCLYSFANTVTSDEDTGVFVRVSESFFFDITPDEIARKFPEVYQPSGEHDRSPHPATKVRYCMFSVPVALQCENLYLVWQCSKVLSGETDKMSSTYNVSYRSTAAAEKANESACRRLYKYRQMFGVGSIRLFDQNKKLKAGGRTSIPSFFIWNPVSDSNLGFMIKDMFPTNVKAEKTRLDPLSIELAISVTEVQERNVDFGVFGASDVPRSSPNSRKLIPSEFHTELQDISVLEGLGASASALVRSCQFRTPQHLLPTDDISRRVRSVVDHSLFVYPMSLENFDERKQRNLCIRFQLVNVLQKVSGKNPFTSGKVECEILPNIYSDQPGALFKTSKHTAVWYHCNPSVHMDEVKIRLPLIITDKHYLKVSVYHIHVQDKDKTIVAKIFGRKSGGNPNEAKDETTYTHVCNGYLPLLRENSYLIQDNHDSMGSETPAHVLKLYAEDGTGQYVLNLRTKVWSSLMSTNKELQSFLSQQPKALGYLPSSTIGTNVHAEVAQIGARAITSDALIQALVGLNRTPHDEISKFFLVIMRILIRIICGGTASFQKDFSSPFTTPIPPVRLRAFEMMLFVFNAVVSGSKYRDQYLLSYAVHYFDEEIPLPRQETPSDADGTASSATVDEKSELEGEDSTTSKDVLFSELKGYKNRKDTINAANGSLECGMQWWPWAYEVLVKLWLEVLNAEMEVISGGSVKDTSAVYADYDEDDDDEETVDIEEDFVDDGEVSHGSDHSAPNRSPRPSVTSFNSSPLNTSKLTTDSSVSGELSKLNASSHLSLEFGPVLLRLIQKSLAVRVSRENLTVPVVLDSLLLLTIKGLIDRIAWILVASASEKLRKKVNAAIALFLGDLFAIVAPFQVATLVYTYLFALKKQLKPLKVDMLLQYLEELSVFYNFVDVNFLLPLSKAPDDYVLLHINEKFEFTPSNLHPHWLAHMLIKEALEAYDSQSKLSTQLKGISILRDLMVRHSYEKRYQTVEFRQRLAAMYIPYLHQLIKLGGNSGSRLFLNSTQDVEKKEVLSVLLYILEDAPQALLRDQWQKMAVSTIASSTNPTRNAQRVNSNDLQILKLLKLLHVALDIFELDESSSSDPMKLLVGPLQSKLGKDGTNLTPKRVARRVTTHVQGVSDNIPNSEKHIAQSSFPNLSLEKLKQFRPESNPKARASTKVTRVQSGELREWKSSANVVGSIAYVPAVIPAQAEPVLQTAAYNVRHTSASVVLSTLETVLEEATPLLKRIDEDSKNMSCYDEFMELSVGLLLHGISYRYNDVSIGKYYVGTQNYLRNFGFRTYKKALGDSLQDWMFVCLSHLCSASDNVRIAACNFVFNLLISNFSAMGSITIVETVALAVVGRVFKVKQWNSNEDSARKSMNLGDSSVDSFEDKSDSFSNFFLSLKHIVNTADRGDTNQLCFIANVKNFATSLRKINEAHRALESCIPDRISSPLSSGKARRPSHMGNLMTKYNPEGSGPIASSPWDRGDSLDGRITGEADLRASKAFGISDRVKVKPEDVDEFVEKFNAAAQVFDPFLLPRFRIRWLECIGRVYDSKESTGEKKYPEYQPEAGEVRWRIYLTCKAAETVFSRLWTTRQSLTEIHNKRGKFDPSSSQENISLQVNTDESLEFFEGFFRWKSAEPRTPWESRADLMRHMQLTLRASAERFMSAPLLFLAERSLVHELNICRAENSQHKMAEVYRSLSSAFQEEPTQGVPELYYRVQYFGEGVPLHLRDKHFIYRSTNNDRLADFLNNVKRKLEGLVRPGVVVTGTSDTNFKFPSDSKDAHVLVVTAHPVIARTSSVISARNVDDMALMNQVQTFQFSVPFTEDGKTHAKDMQSQWKRTVTLAVEHPFPFITLRQEISSRTERILTPIEVAVDDIRERVVMMREERNKIKSGNRDTNNLMRIVQGSVAPQVNLGAAETAKVFLSRADGTSTEVKPLEGLTGNAADRCRHELKLVLIDFLLLSQELVTLSRDVLLRDPSSKSVDLLVMESEKRKSTMKPSVRELEEKRNSNMSDDATTIHQHRTWVEVMESKFKDLFLGIFPYVSDLPQAKTLLRCSRLAPNDSSANLTLQPT